MASHRKPRTHVLQSAAAGRGAVGVTTAALASVSLLSQSANAAPSDDGSGSSEKQSVEEVNRQVDKLYQQAGSSTQKYNAAKERTDRQRAEVNKLLDQVAHRTGRLNDARRVLGNYAAAQYRTGGMSQTATLLLTEDPQGFFKQTHLLDRMTAQQKKAVDEYQDRQRDASAERSRATEELAALSSSQKKLRSTKRDVQEKLAEARQLLSKLTAQEKARLAGIERKKEAEARRKAEARRDAAAEERERQEDGRGTGSGSGSSGGSGPGEGSGTGSGGAYAAKAEKVLAFAEQQLGKPYVWGATGPGSYDCSGFTQDAWKAAGISLPRVTYDQVKVGTKVAKSEMEPGDLVFFYDDISHVGIYAGNGQMIHASKPGDDVKYESVDYMPFHSAVRPA